MVALALDIGETRIGIAVSSRDGKMAMPVKVLPAAEVTGMSKTFRYLVEDYEPDILVSGRPLTMAGEPGPQPSASPPWPKRLPTSSTFRWSLRTSVCPRRRPSESCESRGSTKADEGQD